METGGVYLYSSLDYLSASVNLTAHYVGIHRWLWQNHGQAMVAVRLRTVGFYEDAMEVREGRAQHQELSVAANRVHRLNNGSHIKISINGIFASKMVQPLGIHSCNNGLRGWTGEYLEVSVHCG